MITGYNNRTVRKVIQLNQKAKARNTQDLFVAEGVKMFLEAPEERIRQFHYRLEDLLAAADRDGGAMFMMLEDLQDPGNLGTIFRAGEGAGVTGIIMSGRTVDIYNPKTIRSTMGSVYRIPFIYTDDLCGTADILRKHNINVYAAHLEGKDDYDACDYRCGTAFMIGNEANGLKEETACHADKRIRIPMEGKVESLNAAVASSILMYEAYRQRRRNGGTI